MKRLNFRSNKAWGRAAKSLKLGNAKAQHSAIRKSTTNTLRYVLKVVLGGI